MTVAPLTKFVPLMVSVWALVDPGTGLGDTLLTVGAAEDTVKFKAVELLPLGLTTVAVQVPPSLASLNAESVSWPEFTKVVLWPG